MLKFLSFTVVASAIAVTLTVYLMDIWADIKNFRILIKSAEGKKQAYAFLFDAVVETLIYLIAVTVLPTVLKRFFN